MRKAATAAGLKVLWRAAEQSAQLSSYFDLCRGLGVANARKLPAAFVRLKDDDVRDLERILMSDTQDDNSDEAGAEAEGMAPADVKDAGPTSTTTTTKSGAGAVAGGGGHVSNHWNPFVAAPLDGREVGNLIELF
jgi:hypothetical protein